MPDLLFQKILTLIYTVGYFVLIGAFLATFLVDADQVALGGDHIEWLKGILGTLVGVMTSSVKDQCQFWFGSSNGSKNKDASRQELR